MTVYSFQTIHPFIQIFYSCSAVPVAGTLVVIITTAVVDSARIFLFPRGRCGPLVGEKNLRLGGWCGAYGHHTTHDKLAAPPRIP